MTSRTHDRSGLQAGLGIAYHGWRNQRHRTIVSKTKENTRLQVKSKTAHDYKIDQKQFAMTITTDSRLWWQAGTQRSFHGRQDYRSVSMTSKTAPVGKENGHQRGVRCGWMSCSKIRYSDRRFQCPFRCLYIKSVNHIYHFNSAYITSLSVHFCLEFAGPEPMRVHTNADFPWSGLALLRKDLIYMLTKKIYMLYTINI
jgi:hypothetical protein